MATKEKTYEFCARLREAIGSQSARSFSIKSGLSPAAFHKYLSGQSDPTMHVLIAIANAADVGVEWLATGKGPKRGWSELENTLSQIITYLENKLELEDLLMDPSSKSKYILSLTNEILEGKLLLSDIKPRINLMLEISLRKR